MRDPVREAGRDPAGRERPPACTRSEPRRDQQLAEVVAVGDEPSADHDEFGPARHVLLVDLLVRPQVSGQFQLPRPSTARRHALVRSST